MLYSLLIPWPSRNHSRTLSSLKISGRTFNTSCESLNQNERNILQITNNAPLQCGLHFPQICRASCPTFPTKSKTERDSRIAPSCRPPKSSGQYRPQFHFFHLACLSSTTVDTLGTGWWGVLLTYWINSDEFSQSIFLKPNPTSPLAKQIGINLESSFSTPW